MNELVNLCIDACRGRVSNYAGDSAKYTDDAVRAAFNEILGGKLTYQSWRRHKIEIFEIMEEVLNVNLPNAWNESPFYNELVEMKNFLLGQKNEFVIQDNSVLAVARISGNHWNIDRQKINGSRSFSLETEWFGIRVYDDLERFLKGYVTIDQMFAKMQEGLNKDIDSRVYSAFMGAGTYLPTEFNESGTFVKDTMLTLVDRVQTASGKAARIAGTKQGLAKMGAAIDSAWISNEMKQEQHTTGRVKIWEGIDTIEIPQVFTRGTYDFKIDNNTLLVLPDSYKPVKLYFEGDTRARDLSETDTEDMTIDSQMQTKLGVGVVFEAPFGKYQITA